MTTKSTFSALGAPMSLAWVHGILHVEGSILPKSVESGKLSLDKVGIRWMSAKMSSQQIIGDVCDEALSFGIFFVKMKLLGTPGRRPNPL